MFLKIISTIIIVAGSFSLIYSSQITDYVKKVAIILIIFLFFYKSATMVQKKSKKREIQSYPCLLN